MSRSIAATGLPFTRTRSIVTTIIAWTTWRRCKISFTYKRLLKITSSIDKPISILILYLKFRNPWTDPTRALSLEPEIGGHGQEFGHEFADLYLEPQSLGSRLSVK